MIKNIIKKQIRKTGLVRALEMENEKLKNQIINLKKENIKFKEDNTRLIKAKEETCTVPKFGDLKLTLKGKEDYLFLINDSNNEIRQHFDQSYVNDFNPTFFIEKLNDKVEYCRSKNIKHFFFIVPDKSYVCREFLPFDVKTIKRNYDLIKHLVPDFSDNLDHTCYLNTDTHINFIGGKELSYNILNYIDNNFKRDDFDRLIDEQTIENFVESPYYDLTFPDNWSYSEEEKFEYLNEKTVVIKNKYLKDQKESLPEQFKYFFERETNYYLNEKGFTNLKILVLNDSSTNLLKEVLSIYCKELICYWDHWYFNKELIEWYKPDIILEIRTERFLEGMESQLMYVEREMEKSNKLINHVER